MTASTSLPTTKPPRVERCETCRFWREMDNIDFYRRCVPDIKLNELSGICHRFPPIHDPDEDESHWPFTSPVDWCGEWQASLVRQHPCKVCGKPMKIGPGGFQSNREFCSGKCKQKDHRTRAKAAKEANAAGTL